MYDSFQCQEHHGNNNKPLSFVAAGENAVPFRFFVPAMHFFLLWRPAEIPVLAPLTVTLSFWFRRSIGSIVVCRILLLPEQKLCASNWKMKLFCLFKKRKAHFIYEASFCVCKRVNASKDMRKGRRIFYNSGHNCRKQEKQEEREAEKWLFFFSH